MGMDLPSARGGSSRSTARPAGSLTFVTAKDSFFGGVGQRFPVIEVSRGKLLVFHLEVEYK